MAMTAGVQAVPTFCDDDNTLYRRAASTMTGHKTNAVISHHTAPLPSQLTNLLAAEARHE